MAYVKLDVMLLPYHVTPLEVSPLERVNLYLSSDESFYIFAVVFLVTAGAGIPAVILSCNAGLGELNGQLHNNH